jgi:hypothetical protein
MATEVLVTHAGLPLVAGAGPAAVLRVSVRPFIACDPDGKVVNVPSHR